MPCCGNPSWKQIQVFYGAWQFIKFFYICLFNIIPATTPILQMWELYLGGTQWLSHRQRVAQGGQRSRFPGLGHFLSGSSLLYKHVPMCNNLGAEHQRSRESCAATDLGQGWGGNGGGSGDLLLWYQEHSPTAVHGWPCHTEGRLEVSPISSWPLSEDCVSSLWRAILDLCSVGGTVSLSFLLGRMVMNTCSVIWYTLVVWIHF